MKTRVRPPADASAEKKQPLPNRVYPRTGKRGAPQAFPRKLFQMLTDQPDRIIAWNARGDAFDIHDLNFFASNGALRSN